MSTLRIKNLPHYSADQVDGQTVSSADLSAHTGDPSWASALRIADVCKALGIVTTTPQALARSLGLKTVLYNKASTFVRTSDVFVLADLLNGEDQAERRALLSELTQRLLVDSAARRHASETEDTHTIRLDAPPINTASVAGWVLPIEDGKLHVSTSTKGWNVADPSMSPARPLEQGRLGKDDVYEPAEERAARVEQTNEIISELRSGQRANQSAPEFESVFQQTPLVIEGLDRLKRAFRVVNAALAATEQIADEIVSRASRKTTLIRAEKIGELEFVREVEQLARVLEAQGKTITISQKNEIAREDLSNRGQIRILSRTLTIQGGGVDLKVTVGADQTTIGIMLAALRAAAGPDAPNGAPAPPEC